MTAKEEVLRRIRLALQDVPTVSELPELASADRADEPDLNLLVARLKDYGAEVTLAASGDVARTVAQALSGAASVVAPSGVPEQWMAQVRARRLRDAPPLPSDELERVSASLTGCAVAIAETGTIVLDGGPDQGRRVLTLLPDRHVVVVRADQVVGGVGAALRRLDPRRPQTWVSGPSATSDIELSRVEGVHGPRNLHVVVVRDDSMGAEPT